MQQDTAWYGGRPRSWRQRVRWGPPKGVPKNPLIFSAHVYCGPTATWNKTPLGTEVGLGPGDIVLDGDPAPPWKGTQQPPFRPMSIVAKRSPISATAELSFDIAGNCLPELLWLGRGLPKTNRSDFGAGI